jgi:hypothetical protein
LGLRLKSEAQVEFGEVGGEKEVEVDETLNKI